MKPEFYHNLLPKSRTFKIQILELTVFLPDADYSISFSHGSFIVIKYTEAIIVCLIQDFKDEFVTCT